MCQTRARHILHSVPSSSPPTHQSPVRGFLVEFMWPYPPPPPLAAGFGRPCHIGYSHGPFPSWNHFPVKLRLTPYANTMHYKTISSKPIKIIKRKAQVISPTTRGPLFCARARPRPGKQTTDPSTNHSAPPVLPRIPLYPCTGQGASQQSKPQIIVHRLFCCPTVQSVPD